MQQQQAKRRAEQKMAVERKEIKPFLPICLHTSTKDPPLSKSPLEGAPICAATD